MTRVLLFDDGRLIADLGRTSLARSNCGLRRVGPHDDIVASAREYEPQLVILDEGIACDEAQRAYAGLRHEPVTDRTKLIYVGMRRPPGWRGDPALERRLPPLAGPRELGSAVESLIGLPPRLAERRPLGRRVEARFSGTSLRLHCRDLSLAGAFLQFERPPGREDLVELRMPGPEALTISARVVREQWDEGRPVGCGVQFMLDDMRAMARWSRCVRRAAERRRGAS
ncbi:MAG: PilZ domain-containing protein [Acidobacteriota bacterium]|nr:MAG: PilZ domain-containing protein [Acidobacteriota bacterium]